MDKVIQPIKPLEPLETKVAMLKAGLTQIKIAKEIGVSAQAVNMAINHGQYPRITKLIRELLNLK